MKEQDYTIEKIRIVGNIVAGLFVHPDMASKIFDPDGREEVAAFACDLAERIVARLK